MSDNFRDAFGKAVKRAEERQWVYGLLGRRNQDGTYTFDVPGRRGFYYVTMRQSNGAQTVVPARNDEGVPQQANLGVRMKLEYGVYVIRGRANRSDLVNTPSTPAYGIPAHATSHKDGGTDEIATGTPAAFAIPKADASGLLDSWVTPFHTQEEIEDFVAAQFVGNTGVIDATYDDGTGAITLTLDASAADRYLYSTGADTWAEGTITSFARGLLDDANAATMRTTLGITAYDQETVEDFVGAMVSSNTETGVTVTYDDGTGKLNFDAQTAGDARYLRLTGGTLSGDLIVNANIGINRAVPTAALDVVGSIIGDTNLLITRSSGTATVRASSPTASTGVGSMQAFSDTVDLRFQAYGSGVAGSRASGAPYADSGEFVVNTGNRFLITTVSNIPIHFLTNSNIRMTILGGGDIGIRTTSPVHPLHIVGPTGNATGDIPLRVERVTPNTTSTVTSAIFVGESTGNMADTFGPLYNFVIRDTAAVDNTIARFGAVRDGGDLYGSFVIYTANNATAAERVRVSPAGFMGIGTTSPQGVFHVYDGTTGWLKVTRTGVNGTLQTILPAASITKQIVVTMFADDGSNTGTRFATGVVISGTTTVVAGTTTATLTVTAGGGLTIQRTAGAGTLTVSLDIMYR